MGERRTAHWVLMGKPERKRSLGRMGVCGRIIVSRSSLNSIGDGGEEWNGMAKDRKRWQALVHPVMNFRVQ
jgi:hypothetical protein